MTGLTELTLAEACSALRQKKCSAVELAQAHIRAIEKARALNAFIIETPEKALAMARQSDARVGRGEAGPLEGIPLGIKDLYCTEGVQTTAGSHILEGFVPPYESTVTANLWRDGAVMLGKLNLDEFAMGASTENSAFKTTKNPHDVTRVAGGSSGGSAAAEPPDEPPGTSAAFEPRRRQGEITGPKCEVSFDEPIANSSRLSLPSMTAPSRSRLALTVDS